MSLKALFILFLYFSLLQPSLQYRGNGHGNSTVRRAGAAYRRFLDIAAAHFATILNHSVPGNGTRLFDRLPTERPYVHRQNKIYWKPIIIISAIVLTGVVAIYGKKCYYICKFGFFERTEKNYQKMNNFSDV